MSFASWAVTDCPLKIEYAIEVMREVRRMASTRNDVCGVLYGRLDGQNLSIVRARTLPADADDRAWARLAAAVPSGLTAVGLFTIRDEVSLTRAELDILRRQFPAPWQVALIMTRDGHAGFFTRDRDGTLDPRQSRQTFEVDQLTPSTHCFELLGVSSSGAANQPSPVRFRQSRPAASLLWLLIGAFALGGGYLAAGISAGKRLQLTIQDRGEHVIVSWDRGSVLGAGSGVVEILDGPDRVTRRLEAEDLASGTLTYLRRTGDVSVRLRSNGLDEATRYVGSAPAARVPEEIGALVQRSADLLAAVADDDANLRKLQVAADRLKIRVAALHR